MQDRIIRDLFNLADEKYKKFHSGLCPGTDNIIGVRVPILRKYAKELAKMDFRNYLETARNKYYEEILLQGMVISSAQMSLEERLYHIKLFVPKIDNWAICDYFISGFKFRQEDLSTVWSFIIPYLKSDKEFELRFAVVMMLDHYIIPEYINRVIKELDKIKSNKYYVQMAIAWTISVCFVKFTEVSMEYLKNNNLDDFTYNKSIQKIIESNRVDKEMKGYLRTLKRK